MKTHAVLVISQVFLVLLLSSLVLTWWHKVTTKIADNVDLNTKNIYSGLLSEIESTAKLVQVHPLNSSAMRLARLLSASINQTDGISFNEIQTKVAPILFQLFSAIPHLTQISYVGLDGLLFSYYVDGNQTLSMYANSSFPSNSSSKNYVWYRQAVDDSSGNLYGEAVKSHSSNAVNTSWFQAALSNDSFGSFSVEYGWNSAGEPLFLSSSSIYGKLGVVSLGFPVKILTDVFTGIDLYGGNLSLATKKGKIQLINGIQNTKFVSANNCITLHLMKPNGGAQSFPCTPRNNTSATSSTFTVKIGGNKYNVHCSSLEISGVQSVYALALPHEGLVSRVHESITISLILLAVMIVMVAMSGLIFVVLMVRMAKKEMCLYAKLIKQMEATQQSERKSMNKSLALAGASHDIRSSLAGITGLIDLCLAYIAARPPTCDFEAYLKQMHNCAQDLLGLLNSILDTSKVEAGMMKLEEEEFNLAELVEHVVDLYHPVGMQKGVDVVLDPCDGSVIKISQVKGDRGKLMQILSNLLSNAVKFTPQGHVSLRARVQKPSTFENEILDDSGRNSGLFHKYLPCLFSNYHENRKDDMGVISSTDVRQNLNSIEIVFEVDDTGKGIPKEKQESVFENFVQVKETAAGQVGTGLGLGIVQSLVRLMGGEISIVDKDIGEKGTCFRFNVFMTTSETTSISNTNMSPTRTMTISNSSPKFWLRTSPSPKLEGSQVVLLIQNEERRRVSQKFMESLGISVLEVGQWEYLASALKKIKFKVISPSRRSDLSSRSDSSKHMPLSTMDGQEQISPSKIRGSPSSILLVIDANAGPFSELRRIVAEFRSGLHNVISFKVVWLDKPTSRSINSMWLEPGDELLLQPFHGSSLYQVIKLLPEFGGNLGSSSSAMHSFITAWSKNTLHDEEEIQEIGAPLIQNQLRLNSKVSPVHQLGLQTERKKDDTDQLSNKKLPLKGQRILVAEDMTFLQTVAKKIVTQLGADVEICMNGEEALELVCNGLRDLRNDEELGNPVLPYDYVLMDCQMPSMDGYEATRQIRNLEKQYGVHIPIIALTAHTSRGEAEGTFEAGMDAHLEKPLNKEKLLEAIKNL